MYNTTITYIGLHCSAHWQMVVILPKENLVVRFCSLHNRPDNYLKGIINKSVLFFNTFALALLSNINILMFLVFNSALKGLGDNNLIIIIVKEELQYSKHPKINSNLILQGSLHMFFLTPIAINSSLTSKHVHMYSP